MGTADFITISNKADTHFFSSIAIPTVLSPGGLNILLEVMWDTYPAYDRQIQWLKILKI